MYHTIFSYFTAEKMNFFHSAKYNRTERLLHLFDGSGLLLKHLITTWLHALLCLRDATIRPVLKHGPRSSTGLRVVELN